MESGKKIQRIPGDVFEHLTGNYTSKEVRYVPRTGLPGYSLLRTVSYGSKQYVIGLHRSQHVATLLLFKAATTAACSGDNLILRIDGGKIVENDFVAELSEHNQAKVALNSDECLASFLTEVHNAIAVFLGKYEYPVPQIVPLSKCYSFPSIKKEGEPHQRPVHGLIVL